MGLIAKYTISDIAHRAEVSTATVSRVLNNKPNGVSEETRARIQRIMDEMNYRPSSLARGVATSHSSTIGLIIPDISNLFYPQIVRGVDDYISEHGYSMLLYNSNSDPEREKRQLLTMIDNRADGVIFCSGVTNEAFLREYRRYGTPLVFIGRTFDSHLSDGCVTGDNEKGMYESANFMIGHGHTRILYLDGLAAVSGAINRLQGYRHALFDANIPADPALMCSGEFSVSFGYQTVCRLIGEGTSFTAIVTGSDLVAIGAIKALKACGLRVPEDVEVIGFDNIELSEIFEPALSTVSKPHNAMAKEAARILLSVIEGNRPPINHMIVNASLVLRDTTRKE